MKCSRVTFPELVSTRARTQEQDVPTVSLGIPWLSRATSQHPACSRQPAQWQTHHCTRHPRREPLNLRTRSSPECHSARLFICFRASENGTCYTISSQPRFSGILFSENDTWREAKKGGCSGPDRRLLISYFLYVAEVRFSTPLRIPPRCKVFLCVTSACSGPAFQRPGLSGAVMSQTPPSPISE